MCTAVGGASVEFDLVRLNQVDSADLARSAEPGPWPAGLLRIRVRGESVGGAWGENGKLCVAPRFVPFAPKSTPAKRFYKRVTCLPG